MKTIFKFLILIFNSIKYVYCPVSIRSGHEVTGLTSSFAYWLYTIVYTVLCIIVKLIRREKVLFKNELAIVQVHKIEPRAYF